MFDVSSNHHLIRPSFSPELPCRPWEWFRKSLNIPPTPSKFISARRYCSLPRTARQKRSRGGPILCVYIFLFLARDQPSDRILRIRRVTVDESVTSPSSRPFSFLNWPSRWQVLSPEQASSCDSLSFPSFPLLLNIFRGVIYGHREQNANRTRKVRDANADFIPLHQR
jgi:hypothetical protein